jgi:hypothetical protein
MSTANYPWWATASITLVLPIVAACSDAGGSSTSENLTPLTIVQHVYKEGESFEWFYEGSEATYATEPVHDGQVPRVTDLQQIDEIRTHVRINVISEGGKLRKRLELTNIKVRERTAGDLQQGADIPFEPIQERIPDFPADFSYTYDIGTEGDVAGNLGEVFGVYMNPLFYKLVDVFTWPAVIENIPLDLAMGKATVRPAVDVNLFGLTFHNHHRVTLFDRIDRIGGAPQAYVKVQSPGNYLNLINLDTNYQLAFHTPLTGDTTGLVATGELQEILLQNDPVTATIRQVSMTMQNEDTQTAIYD